MTTKLTFSARLGMICLVSISSAYSQISLTRALDFDGDRRADPAIFRANDNSWWASVSSGGHVSVPFGNSLVDTITPGDFDGDGRGDICSWREPTGTFHCLRSSDGVAISIPFGQPGDEPVARDYDGDGKTDFAVVRRLSGYLYWYIHQSSTNAWLLYQYGISTDTPVPGDYDGDGSYDMAVQRPYSGQALFYIYRSSLGSIAYQFGFESDFVVPGDYDGDGKTDLALCRWEFRNGDNYEWYRLLSSNGSIQQSEFGGADSGDVIAQADYDGDGLTDIAVWRGPERKFYILHSSSGQVVELIWGQLGDLPVASYDTH